MTRSVTGGEASQCNATSSGYPAPHVIVTPQLLPTYRSRDVIFAVLNFHASVPLRSVGFLIFDHYSPSSVNVM